MDNFSHLQSIEYDVMIGDHITPKIALFNCNKLPLGVAVKCIENDAFNKYLLTLTKEQYVALFLDDNDVQNHNDSEENKDEVK